MIVDLPSTSSQAISKRLVRLRNDTGAMTLGRVLTLIIVVHETDADGAIEAANQASRQHPCRIIVLVRGNRRGTNRIDAQIRVGGDAGASEVIVLRVYGQLADQGQSVLVPLLLPDSPVVAWWPKDAPEDVARSPIGAMAQRRITDSAEASQPHQALKRRSATYQPGDTDLAWTRITLWRGLLAAALDEPPFEPVLEATVTGATDSPSSELLAGWLAQTLRCPVHRARGRRGTGVTSVRLERRSGSIDLVRPSGTVATLAQPGQPIRRISLSRRTTTQCLADELRRLDPDEIYGESLTRGIDRVARRTVTGSNAVAEGEAPSPLDAQREARRLRRRSAGLGSSQMTAASSPPGRADGSTVEQAAVTRLAEFREGEPAVSKKSSAARSKVGTSPEATSAVKKKAAGKPSANKASADTSAAASPATRATTSTKASSAGNTRGRAKTAETAESAKAASAGRTTKAVKTTKAAKTGAAPSGRSS